MKTLIVIFSVFTVCLAQTVDVTLQNYTIKNGGSAEIPCTYTANDISGADVTITWYAGSERQRLIKISGTTISRDSGYTRREISATNEGSLLIPNTTLADNKDLAHLTCEVEIMEPGNSSPSSGQGSLEFMVVLLPSSDPVTELSDEEFNLSEVKISVGTCQSGYGHPTPTITFYKGDDEIEEDNIDGFAAFTQDIVTEENGDGATRAKKTLVIPITASDDEAEFYCQVTGGSGDVTSDQKVAFPTFRVIYPTSEVSVTPEQTNLFEGDVVTFNCEANGYPTPEVQDFYGDTSKSVEIPMTKSLSGTEVECVVQYTGASSTVTGDYIISVLYADTPEITGNTNVAMGTKLSLKCTSMSHPTALSVKWKKNGAVVSETGTLAIERTQFSDSGEYTCEAENQHNKLTKMNTAMVDITGLDVDTTEKEVGGVIGDSVQLICSAKASSQPTFMWMKAGSDEDFFGADTSNPEENEYSNTLTIGPLDETMSEAMYHCTVKMGSDSENKDFKLPHLQAAGGGGSTATIIIIILVLLLLVAVVLAVLYNKGIICNKGEKGDENAEDIEVEIPKDNGDDVEAGKPPKEPVNEETGLMNGNED